MVKRTRVANPEAAAAELAEHYARILGQHADRQVSNVIRTCLRRLPSCLPIQGEDLRAVEELIERIIRLGEVGARDPIGSPREIDDYIARRLGEPASGARRVYRALRAMLGHTVLVERRSRQIWVLRLSGLTDSSSILHRTLLAETPALYSLPASDTESAAGSEAPCSATADDPVTPSQPPEPLEDPSEPLRAELVRLHEELAAERLARVEVDKRREATDAALGEEKCARSEADQRAQVAAAQLTALERELDTLRRALDQERRARGEADLRGQANAAQCTTLVQDLGLLRDALDEERRARGDADLRVQFAEAELVVLGEAQAADAATVRRLIECDQVLGAAAFLIARMHGHSVEVALQSLHQLLPAAAAVLSASTDQSPQASRTGGAPGAPAAVDTTPQSRADPPTQVSPRPTSGAPTVSPHGTPALAAPLPSSLPPASASSDRSATIQASGTAPAASPRRPSTQRRRLSQAPALLASEMQPDQPDVKPSKIGRNDPCPCGSGTRFKRCCGRPA